MSAALRRPRFDGAGVPFSVVNDARRQALASQMGSKESSLAARMDPHAGLLATERERWARLTEECSSALALMGGPSTVGITSTVRGEGRSSIAIATALAQRYRFPKTILLEADLERPSLAKMLGVQGDPGVAEVIREEAGLAACIQWPTPTLGVLTAGSVGSEATLLASHLLSVDIIPALLGHCDSLVIDLPPFAGVGVGLARLCPTVLLVIKARSTPKDKVSRVAAELGHAAALLNQTTDDLPRWMRGIFRNER